MKTEEILNLDYRIDENKILIQKFLRKIKPLSDYDISKNIPFEKLEKLAIRYCKKYDFYVKDIIPIFMPDDVKIYRAIVAKQSDRSDIKSIYGCCLYELFAKLNIYFCYLSRKE